MLCDIVSRGGNFLLDIGPTADGRIPVVMQDRLINMGKWLEVNGEAIFETRRWKKDCQWGEGEIIEYTKQEFHKAVPDPIIEMARYPREGQARKECYFTSKNNTVYALITKLPDGDKFVIKDMELCSDSEVSMLGFEGTLEYQSKENNIIVTLPNFNPSTMPCDHVYTLKLTNVL